MFINTQLYTKRNEVNDNKELFFHSGCVKYCKLNFLIFEFPII